MKKFYLSADIEGTCGIVCWDETEYGDPRYAYFAKQMSREVAAACEGALAAGAEDILVRDAHDSARNIDPSMLPIKARIFRNWERHPFAMMCGIDGSFAGAMFTGYHSSVGMDTNPLSHTMNTRNTSVLLNGEPCPELYMNCLTAAYVGVPIAMVAGDKGICEWIEKKVPGVITVPVNEGIGNGSVSIHPDLAVQRIREAAEKAANMDLSGNMFPMPEHFKFEVSYREHSRAHGAQFYPGCVQTGPYSVCYESDDWMDVLKFIHWVL